MDWFRWHHGTVADPKFSIVAKRSGQPRHVVIACWSAILEYASTRDDRGSIGGIDPEEIAIVLDLEIEQVDSILIAMRDKHIIDECDYLSGWNKRQPKREDSTGAERKQRWKEKQQVTEEEQPGTQRNAMERLERARTEQNREEFKNIAPENPPALSDATLKTVKPKKPAGDPRHKWITDWWYWSFETITGAKYAYGADDAGIIATLLKKIDFNQTIERACCYLLMPDEQRFPRGAPTLKGLQFTINQLAASFDEKTENKALAYRILPSKGITLQNYKPWEHKNGD
jgi:hypothetical protein